MKKFAIILASVLGALVVLGCGIGVIDSIGHTDTPTVATGTAATPTSAAPTMAVHTAAPATTKAAPAKPAVVIVTISGDGTFAVGSQVKPGTYRAVVPADSFGCYWERLKGASGQLDDVIANGLGDPGAQQLVTIKATDKYFSTQYCGTWTRVS